MKKYNKFVLINLFIVTLFISFSCESQNKIKSSKPNCLGDECKKELIIALMDLSKIQFPDNSSLNDSQIKMQWNQIHEIINRFDNPEDLFSLALLSRTMANHCSVPDVTCSKASNLIPTFENAYWDCVKNLSKNVEQNRDILDNLKKLSNLNGTERGDWNNIVDRIPFP